MLCFVLLKSVPICLKFDNVVSSLLNFKYHGIKGKLILYLMRKFDSFSFFV